MNTKEPESVPAVVTQKPEATSQSPASLNVLDFKDTVHVRLMLFNDISHYKDQPLRSDRRLSKWWGDS